MKRKQALKILNKALADYRHRLTFDANLYRAGLITPATKRAYNQLAQLDEALKILIYQSTFFKETNG